MNHATSAATPDALNGSPASSTLPTALRRVSGGLGGWWREPLLHFLLIGGVLFGLDHLRNGGDEDALTIVVGAAVDKEARELFMTNRGREPNAQELTALRKVWLDNEVLYREGLALKLDRGDTAIRERVIFKALSVVDADTRPAQGNEAVLRQWFEAHRAKYDEPARYDFQEAVLAGEHTPARVQALVDTLVSGAGGDLEAGLRVFKGRPQANIDYTYGADFGKAMAKATPGVWQAIEAKDGWHAVRVEAITPPRPADFEAVRQAVQQDWLDGTMAEQRSAAVRKLAGKYKIRFEGDAARSASATPATPATQGASK
jgi:hypothetical protein